MNIEEARRRINRQIVEDLLAQRRAIDEALRMHGYKTWNEHLNEEEEEEEEEEEKEKRGLISEPRSHPPPRKTPSHLSFEEEEEILPNGVLIWSDHPELEFLDYTIKDAIFSSKRGLTLEECIALKDTSMTPDYVTEAHIKSRSRVWLNRMRSGGSGQKRKRKR